MKKELYLNIENQEVKINYWKNQIKEIKTHRPFVLNTKKIALIVLDMQKCFVDPSSHSYIPSSEYIIHQIRKLLSFAESNNIFTVLTRHTNEKNQDNIMNYWWGDIIEESNPYSEITSEIDVFSYPIIKKHTYSAFYDTSLHSILKEHKITQLIICGVMTHLCVETTTRDAFLHNYEIFLPMDATATYTEEFHLGTLKAIQHGFGIVCTVEDVLQKRI